MAKKVLFIDPPSVIEDQMIQFLVTAQYETAVLKDMNKLPDVIESLEPAIIYFNLDSRTSKALQESMIDQLLTGENQQHIVGFLSYDKNEELAQKYLMEMGASGGYITLDLGFKKSAQILLAVLQASEAKGDRKFVRGKVPPGKGQLNLEAEAGKVEGEIIDLSIAGMACRLEKQVAKGYSCPNIQLNLWGSLVTVGGTVAGQRETDNGNVTVIMFDRELQSETRSKIYTFLRRIMQYEIDNIG